ncbi:MAG TPA: tail fiber domain-containing protein, partial [Chitinophagaceae bacterium]|nr:tail fiber domain-containing protein [Chitinophagaceae bacterium]
SSPVSSTPGQQVIAFYARPLGAPGAYVTCFYGAGNMNITGSYFSSSDRKLKQHIQSLQSGMLDKIMQLTPSTYDYRTEEYQLNLPKGKQFGLIAQDVQAIFPELVAEQIKPADTDPNTKQVISQEIKYLGVNYTGLIPIIISGVQEQQVKIIALEKENAQLKKDMAAIKTKLGL